MGRIPVSCKCCSTFPSAVHYRALRREPFPLYRARGVNCEAITRYAGTRGHGDTEGRGGAEGHGGPGRGSADAVSFPSVSVALPISVAAVSPRGLTALR